MQLQDLFFQLQNQLSSADSDARRASQNELFGMHGQLLINLHHNELASAGYSIKVAQNHWKAIIEHLTAVVKIDPEIARICREIDRDLQTAYSQTNGNNYPNHVSTNVGHIESHLHRLKLLLAKHNLQLR